MFSQDVIDGICRLSPQMGALDGERRGLLDIRRKPSNYKLCVKIMREEIGKALDEEQEKERRNLFLSVFLVVGVVIVLGALLYPVSFKTMHGVTVAYTAKQTEMGSKEKVDVRLQSGQKVLASFPQHLVYKNGAKAEVVEGRALLGRRSYKVIRYVE